ncbi:MAG TPA: OPT/YSL family transporter, partial [Polyangia bacterium]|nr:OPT/YSL family transporter [Polyangia bacterium]
MSVPQRRRFLPAPGTTAYHLLLGAVALLILGPLGAVTNAYMTFSLGFAIGGQVLAGILGSTVTYGYGAEGKHGANYIQTMAASVSSVAGMGVLIQAMVWLGMPLPPAWKLALYFGCIGMFGIGVGMLYTPVLVDRLQLEFPSGHAVANILRALTDVRLLRRSIGKLGGGTAAGIALAGLVSRVTLLERIGISASTLGAGLIVGSRIGVPTLVMGAIGWALTPWLRAAGYLGPHDPFRKIGFLVGLSMIMGAAAVDMAVIGREAVRRVRAQAAGGQPAVARRSGGLGG